MTGIPCRLLDSLALAVLLSFASSAMQGQQPMQPAVDHGRSSTQPIGGTTVEAGEVVTHSINIGGHESWDEAGDLDNQSWSHVVGSGGLLTGIGWDLTLSTVSPSKLSESQIAFHLWPHPPITLVPGAGDDYAGMWPYSSGGILDLFDDLHRCYAQVGSAGGLFLWEYSELIDNFPDAVDASYVDGHLHFRYILGDGLEGVAFHVALGDSFSSGEGAGKYSGATNDYRGWGVRNLCHRSCIAWTSAQPSGLMWSSIKMLPVTNHVSYSCSGALIRDLYWSSHRKYWDGWTNAPGPQLDEGMIGQADLITLTIGGNDIGFGEVIKQCAFLELNGDCFEDKFKWNDPMTIDQVVRAEISRLHEGELCEAYLAVKQAANDAPVVVVGYPNVVEKSETSGGWSSEESNWTRQINLLLWRAIKESARHAGVHAVSDTRNDPENEDNFVANHFDRHGAHSVSPWINDIRQSAVFPNSHLSESYHPNSRGQLEMAQVVNWWIYRERRYNPDLENPDPIDPIDPCGDLSAPRAPVTSPASTGDLIVVTASPAACVNSYPAAVRGELVTLIGHGFGPESTVGLEMRFESVPGIFLGTATTDSLGQLDDDIYLPLDVPTTGLALFRASGDGENGGPRLLLGVARLEESLDRDSDFDGIPDACDNCPLAWNSPQRDLDQDGLGDQCDACPEDHENDLDNDGLCGNNDACFGDDLTGDVDQDGVCADQDCDDNDPDNSCDFPFFLSGFESGDTSAWSGTVQ